MESLIYYQEICKQLPNNEELQYPVEQKKKKKKKKKNYYDVTTYWRAVFFLFEPHFFLFISFVVFAVVGVVFEGWTDVLEQSEIGIAAE